MAWSERKSHSFAYALRNEFGVLAVDELRLGSKGSSSQLMLTFCLRKLILKTYTSSTSLQAVVSQSNFCLLLLNTLYLYHSLPIHSF